MANSREILHIAKKSELFQCIQYEAHFEGDELCLSWDKRLHMITGTLPCVQILIPINVDRFQLKYMLNELTDHVKETFDDALRGLRQNSAIPSNDSADDLPF
ncbi:MAG: hypothetical protein ABSH28_09080 [Acidobacteriota bacterium]